MFQLGRLTGFGRRRDFSVGGGGGEIVATGGNISLIGGYKIHTFASSGTFQVTSGSGDVEYLVVGGGGSGGWAQSGNAYAGGGGGAGGYRTNGTTDYSVSVNSYTVTVGAGGVGTTSSTANGDDSVFDAITSLGGGFGAEGTLVANDGGDGGSGGASTFTGTAGLGTGGQGNDGAAQTVNDGSSSGGGGASAAGSPNSSGGGAGGAGSTSSISGISTTYAGGGGGGAYGGSSAGSGGAGGGGAGGLTRITGTAGTANMGGGGGGGGSQNGGGPTAGGNGGDGVVIVRYLSTETIAPGLHRFWRIANINVPGGSHLEISELQFIENSTNVTGDGTISSSIDPSFGAITDLTDGNTGTRCFWTAAVAEALGFWIQIDFGYGDEKDIDGIKQAGFDTSTRYMESFTLQYSDDGITFFTLGSQKGLSYPGNNTLSSEYPFVPLTANRRYWRWLITDNDSDATYTSWAEVELRATVGGADVIPTSSATASIEAPDAANGGVDNNSGTEWVAQNNNVFPQWFQVDLGVSTDLSLAQSLMESQRVIVSGVRTPTAWTIECSTDTVAWMAVDQRSGVTWATFNEVQLFTV